MISPDKVELVVMSFYNHPEHPFPNVFEYMQHALVEYEKSKWVKFNTLDKETYPSKDVVDIFAQTTINKSPIMVKFYTNMENVSKSLVFAGFKQINIEDVIAWQLPPVYLCD